MKRIVLLAAAFVLLLTGTAHAHTDWENYWPDYLPTNHTVYLSSNTGWTTAEINAVQAAIDVWNDVPSANTNLVLDTNTRIDFGGCILGNNSVIEKVGANYLGENSGSTKTCGVAFDHQIDFFRIQFETPAASYWGSNIPEPSGDRGIRGVLVHELGHAFGGNHWAVDSVHCDDTAGQGDWHTMCQAPYWGGGTPPAGESQENRSITLGDHDITGFQSRY